MTTATAPSAPPQSGGRFTLKHQALLVFTMCICSVVSFMLFMLRVVKTDQTTYYTLNWNLLLAWIPAVMALLAYNIFRKGSCIGIPIALFCAVTWLAFFPNAPYLLTDIVHLRPREEMPYWFDQILYLAYAFSGCYLGLVSLLLMQATVRRWLGRWISWIFAITVMVLSGFGIYIGRYLRFNSWDLLANPKPIVKEVVSWIQHPKSNSEAFLFSFVFFLFFASVYFVVVAMVNLSKEDRPGKEIRA